VEDRDSNGSMDRSHLALVYAQSSVSDWRLGVDWGKFGTAAISSSRPERLWTCRVVMFLARSAIRPKEPAPNRCMSMVTSRRAAFARSRLAFANSIRSSDISVQFSGAEVMDSRQYRHTCVSGTIDLASRASSPKKHRAIRERISGGSLFTGCNMFRKEGRNSKISRALVSRVFSWMVEHQTMSPHSLRYQRSTFTHLQFRFSGREAALL